MYRVYQQYCFRGKWSQVSQVPPNSLEMQERCTLENESWSSSEGEIRRSCGITTFRK